MEVATMKKCETNCESEESGAATAGCGCGKSECGCGSGEGSCGSGDKGCCSDNSCGSGSEGHAQMIFGAAMQAKHELLVSKIKVKLEKTHGKKFDKVASLVAEVLAAKWKGKQEMAKKWEEFNGKLEAIFKEGK